MNRAEVINVLKNELNFTNKAIKKLINFHDFLIERNIKYNLISKSSEKEVWSRHILDSAQLVKFINIKKACSITDLGSGAGFPGMVLAIFFENTKFHVKLVEKSPVKRDFLEKTLKKLSLEVAIVDNAYKKEASSDVIVCRAFKKLPEIIKISREIMIKPHKIIILKGKDAQAEINTLSLEKNYRYSLKNSMTDEKSKIIVFEVKK